ncbi:regulatory protein MerR [Kribbella flavida DSM 17836]|uniref:Regulatory protein MerR n=1 Tax=Kribbella flavida (strain DSM 17836 / JCM 10339 / NBRC 14399) TaxID=479435 RepID=D2PS51_KRIFD|nr:helix-turn-helix domain-containing protein [Kribbella flavida]ADB31175.1 regulatory protein MerR [Kribbella flavida DSM 17836]
MSVPKHRDGRLWSVEDLSEFLGIPVATLYRWRTTGYGPAGVRMGKYIRYDQEVVRAWIKSLENVA